MRKGAFEVHSNLAFFAARVVRRVIGETPPRRDRLAGAARGTAASLPPPPSARRPHTARRAHRRGTGAQLAAEGAVPRPAAGLQGQGRPAPTSSSHQAPRTRRPSASGGRRAAVAGCPACAPRSRAQTRRPSGARRAAGAHTCPTAAAGNLCGAAVRRTGGREREESGRRRGPCFGGRRARLEALDAAPQAPPHHGPEAAALPLPVLGLARAVQKSGGG
ncbi:uncharacterized protein LOC123389284 [Mustela putorius furo]|uniref:Uncharacterized protein LOC123389284 n=1 Tax=Mustela putorius furo TaxID=9669 RepID=A0A8U0RND8_MUSPF|nr:uncharacterized protein LOC123389284 [Mustela putorius furo]